MKFFTNIKKLFNNKNPTSTRFELLTERGNGCYSWNGNLYRSEILRSIVRPFVIAAGKLEPKHIRENESEIKINPDIYLKMFLNDPNPLLTSQKLREKLAWQYMFNGNAFAYILRDVNGYPIQLYPINSYSVMAKYDKQMNLFLEFVMQNGKKLLYPYTDIIHVPRDFGDNELFGSGNREVLMPLMNVVGASDGSVVSAIKNSGVIKWLLQFNRVLTPDALKKQSKIFYDAFLESEENSSIGVAATGTDFEAKQIEPPKDYVPNALLMDRTTKRVMSYFNTNEKITMSNYSEDDWNAFFEANIEPFSKALSEEFTRKLFTRRERSFGNRIVFDSTSLQYASMSTKLNLVQLVDRGAMTPNEWRKVLNLSPIEGGDKVIRRLDTAVINEKGGEAIEKKQN